MENSLRKQLIVTLSSVILLCCSAMALLSYQQERTEMEAIMDAQIVQAAKILLEYTDITQHRNLSKYIGFTPSVASFNPLHQPELGFQVWSDKNELLYRSRNIPSAALVKSDGDFQPVSIDGNAWLVYASSNPQHSLRVVVAQSVPEREQLLDGIALKQTLGYVLFAGILLGIVVFSVNSTFNPWRPQLEQRKALPAEPN